MFWRTWRYYVGLLGLLLGLSACVTEDLRNPIAEGQGYLRLELASVATELSSSPQTKASTTSIPSEDIPDASDFTIDIQKGGTSVDGFPKLYSEINSSSLVLATGDYTVSAYSGENTLIQATPYFFGSTDVTVIPNQQVKASIEASLANALLVPVVDESLQKHYSAWELTVKVGEESMRLASKENSNNHLYVKAGQSVMGLFNGMNLVGKETSTEWTMISETASRTQYTIQCNPDLSVFSNIQLMATATHIYDNGSLTGTEVILSLAANGAPVEAVASWDIKVLYNGETIRTYSNTPTNATMNVSDGWPYVPQGSTLSASISLKSGDIVDLPSVSMATIPLPTFTATVSGSTSYSVYKSSGATAANERDGSSIFDISSSVNISSDILDNTNYSNLLKVTYTTDGGGNSGELPYGSVGTLSGLAWQKHALTATVIFDGVTDTSSVDCYVTGVPFSQDLRANKDISAWKVIGDTDYDSGCGQQILYFYSTNGKRLYARMYSPVFNMPEDMSINYTIGNMFMNSLRYARSCTIYSGVVYNTDIFSQDFSDNITSEKSWGKVLKIFTHDVVMQKGNNMVSVYHNELYYRDLTQYWLYLTTLDVKYR